MTEIRPGKLLVASPLLEDPNFRRAVVLVCMYSDEGTMGVVLNRPLEIPVVDRLAAWSELVASPAVFFDGGPVEPNLVVALARGDSDRLSTSIEPGFGLVDLETDPHAVPGAFEVVRLFGGYAGWGAGQFESELGEDAWYIVDALPGDAFTEEPDTLWREVLRRQSGDLQMLAYYPERLELN
ncbi:MAG: YqgE/AlgH family protein [Dehalococcoidia bacterium]|jgi:putative transcriptional regulator|nr:YqgE/AlgH family protein [Dehalococcoidia bacterium]